jgi:hypothetical protein
VVLQAISNFIVVLYFGVKKMQRRIRDMFGDDDYQEDTSNSSGNSDTLGSGDEDEPGKESWRTPGMKSDAELLKEIRAKRQIFRASDRLQPESTDVTL